jgi:hypothetical protein
MPDICGLCSKRVDEVERVHHHHICMALKRKECLVRHNLLLRTLVDIAKSANYVCMKEPVRVGGNADGRREAKLIPDLLMLSPTPGVPSLYVDLCVTHPAAKSHVRPARTKELSAASKAEKGKHKKYDKMAREEKAEFVPFVMETSGAFGSEADKLLGRLTDEYANMDASSSVASRPFRPLVPVGLRMGEHGKRDTFLSRARGQFAVALARGNALLADAVIMSAVLSRAGQAEMEVDEEWVAGSVFEEHTG